MPPEVPEGAYSFHLSVVSVSNPDEEYDMGPSVGFRVPHRELHPKRKPFPWWIPAAAAGAVLLGGLALLWPDGKEQGAEARPAQPREEQRVTVTEAGGPLPQPWEVAPAVQDEKARNEGVLRFNGTNSFVDLANPSYLNFSGLITIEAWIKPVAGDGLRNILAHGYSDQTSGEVFLRLHEGKYEVGSRKHDGASHSVSVPIPDEDLGQWVHLAGVYNGSEWILYRNGMEEDAVASSVGAVPVSARWTIGARGAGNERCFWGDIREVRIWDRARSRQEIKQGMNGLRQGDEQGLLGYWPLGEGQGTTAFDFSNRERNGIIHNGLWQAFDTPPSLNLNGQDAYVALPAAEALDFTGPITLEAWIRPQGTEGLHTIVARVEWDSSVPNGVWMCIDRGAYKIRGLIEGSTYEAAAAVPSEDPGEWVHLAGVYDGAQWILYRNGERLGSSPAPVGAVKAHVPWTIGALGNSEGSPGVFNYFFIGGIRDVRIWATARTQEEIRRDMKWPPGKSDKGLAGYWPMNEGAGSAIKDHAAQANGTIHNGRW